VSIRNPLLPQIFAHPELVDKWYSRLENGDVDLRHVSISASPTAFATSVREKRGMFWIGQETLEAVPGDLMASVCMEPVTLSLEAKIRDTNIHHQRLAYMRRLRATRGFGSAVSTITVISPPELMTSSKLGSFPFLFIFPSSYSSELTRYIQTLDSALG